MAESVHTHLMFQNGRALEALRCYEEIFDGAFTIDELDTYDESSSGPTGQVQLAVCTLLGRRITCVDSPIQHQFDMTPAISLFVECNTEDELERLFVALAEDGVVFMPSHSGACARDPSTQNSLPSGSWRTTHDCSPCPTSARVAPSPRSRSTSASRSSGRKSRCNRFLIVLCSGTSANRSPGRRSGEGRISNSSGSSLTTIHPSASLHQLPSAQGSSASIIVCSQSRLTTSS
jgi:predicted 3-demethylubiquinone-9 3-methyltransferase (glyoxalase superfamily)